jgi:hypothetical protein
MPASLTILNKKSASKALDNAKFQNKDVEDFHLITDAGKNTITGVPVALKKALATYIGNKKATIILWRS